MALMETHYSSFAMGGNVTLNVFVPTPGSSEAITEMNTTKKYDYEHGLPVLYLLHGAFGDAFSWIRYSNIDRYAQDKGIVVVMASAENSFYQDLKYGRKYYTFFTEELPKFIQSVFPVSKDRSKTFIAGFSMGGYGAWYLGLRRPDLYAKAASRSGAIDLASLAAARDPKDNTFSWENSFSDVLNSDGSFAIAGSKYDPFALYDKAVANGCVPKLYMACGKDDFLYQSNLHVKQVMEDKGADFKYVEDEGAHDWNFWDKYIQDILDWLLND
ncbi:MAG: tributyrin esterase [Pseudobutyrivibrio sp.]|nr:tributyrin esterase [Pseudobutyrivibrio sp.]